MSTFVRHILLTLISIAVLCSCTKGDDVPTSEQSDFARLCLSVSTFDGAPYLGLTSRAEYANAATDGEKMQTLRIVIVRPDGTVEHNKYFDFHQTPTTEFGVATFKVAPDTQKIVYLFANENAPKPTDDSKLLNYDFNQKIVIGQQFPEAEIADLKISLTENVEQLSSTMLPMCETHILDNIVYTEKNRAYEYSADLFVVRAATKFTFNIKNMTSQQVVTSNLKIDKLARIEYYMPNGTEYSEPDVTMGGREITGYNVPTINNNDYYTFKSAIADKTLEANMADFISLGAPIYLLEGKYTDAESGGKNHKLSLTINGVEDSAYFPELPTLPRNTHAVVNITIKDAGISCTVQVMPYGAYELNPDFGI